MMMATYRGVDAWDLDPAGFPAHAPLLDQVRFALQWAVLAPSGHNTQPWLFRPTSDGAEVLADRRRALPVVDPHDRELTISVAAAGATLALALRRFRFAVHVDWLPETDDPDLVARLHITGRHEPTNDDVRRFDAITSRLSNRMAFGNTPVDPSIVVRLGALADAEGASLVILSDEQKLAAADLIANGDRIQMHDKAFRRELASWTRASRSHHRDGIRGYGLGLGDLASRLGPTLIRAFDIGKSQAAKDRALVGDSPIAVVLCTASDTPTDWVATGRALTSVFLHLTSAGLAGSFLNQPIEVPGLRSQLAMVTETTKTPQLLLRVGEATTIPPHAPRRPLTDVILTETRTP
jgi:hypothetical protein